MEPSGRGRPSAGAKRPTEALGGSRDGKGPTVVEKGDSRSPVSIGLDWGARVTSIGLEFALPAVLGHFLDKWLETAPWLTLVGATLGLITGMTHVLRLPAELARAEKRRSESGSTAPRDLIDPTEKADGETSSD